jgi:hypothetical protein
MAKPGKGGKGGGPLKGLAGIVGKEKLKLAQQIAANPEAMAYYSKPGELEKYYNSADTTLKDNTQIAAEQAATFNPVRAQAAQMQTSGQNLSQGFTQALGAATGGLAGLAGGNAAAMLDLMQTGQSTSAGAGAYGAGISNLAGAELLQADIQQASYEAQAKAARDAMYQDMKQKALAAKEERLKGKMGLKSTEKSNILSALSSLFSLAGAAGKGGSGGGSGSSSSTTTPTTVSDATTNDPTGVWASIGGLENMVAGSGNTPRSGSSNSYSTYVRGPGDTADQVARIRGQRPSGAVKTTPKKSGGGTFRDWVSSSLIHGSPASGSAAGWANDPRVRTR